MLKGKAYARAVHAHHLSQLALAEIIFKEMKLDDDEFSYLKDYYRMTDIDVKKNCIQLMRKYISNCIRIS